MFAPCPLYPRKRTSLNARRMSALCHKQTSAISFDKLICASGKRGYMGAASISEHNYERGHQLGGLSKFKNIAAETTQLGQHFLRSGPR